MSAAKTQFRFSFLIIVLLLASACAINRRGQKFAVNNHLNSARQQETVAIPLRAVQGLANTFGAENLYITDLATGEVLVSQVIDQDGDGSADEILFQTNIAARTTRKFRVKGASNGAAKRPKSATTTFSRFVPERIDDYAWENDRVAFRTYGPEAQRLTEAGSPNGTLTSGIDCWLKQVNYPVIDKWYQKNTQEAGYYHKEHGEGYDPYHVGASRGCGGIGVWSGDSLCVSKNFVAYKTLATGPIRTLFELTYAPWSANGTKIMETKRISLDLGSQLYRMEEILQHDGPLERISVGLTLHDEKGIVKADAAAGWFRYWEPIDDAQMGVGIVINPAHVQDFRHYRSPKPDENHEWINVRLTGNKVVYYAGFGWSKAGVITSSSTWDAYLADFAQRLASPLEVKFKQ